jgi:phosphohistidine phosphatase SixA
MTITAVACALADDALAQQRSNRASLVILVRHAEKEPSAPNDPDPDPNLTAAGIERARALAAALQSAGVSAIITTDYRRTQQTAQPLAEQAHLTPQLVPLKGNKPIDHHIADVVAAVRRNAGETVVVIGHTPTIPRIIAELGGPAVTMICESSYGHLFLIAPVMGQARLVQARYGAADPAPQAGCQ